MTLEEAIKHAEEVIVEMSYEFQESVALQDHKNAKLCRECAEEHRQLAEWLKDYKRLLEQEPTTHGKMLVCPNCGLDVHSDFKTCPRCGEKMESEDKE